MNTIQQLNLWLDQNITQKEIETIKIYTSAKGYDINYQLKNNNIQENNKSTIFILDNLFNRIPKIEQSIVVYRSIDNQYKEILNTYTSTTINLNTLIDTKNKYNENINILEITVCAGCKIIPL